MTVYIDKSCVKFGRMVMCHMVADTLDELHKMAENIGLKRCWFQETASTPHYDVCLSKRVKALKLGAVELDRCDFVAVLHRIREGFVTEVLTTTSDDNAGKDRSL